jgi:hypothetical protein
LEWAVVSGSKKRRGIAHEKWLAVYFPHRVFLPLIGLFVSSCADKATAVRAEQQSQAAPVPEHPTTVPYPLWGVWYIDDADGQASCRKYLITDAATIERTGQDPLIGAVVISRQIVHRYSEYGEGDFFVVSKASKDGENAWTLSGQVFVDSLPGEGERGAEFSERLELSKNGTTFSSSEAAGQTFFRCGSVRDDLYGAK